MIKAPIIRVVIPQEVVQRAGRILTSLELNSNLQDKIRNRLPQENQLLLFAQNSLNPQLEAIKKEILELDIDSLTPLEALNTLHRLRGKIKKDE